MKLLKNITEPTDMVILPAGVWGRGNDNIEYNEVKINDDYSGFDIRVEDEGGDEEKIGVCCDGFGTVLTKEEFDKINMEDIYENMEDPVYFILPEFEGEINASVEDRNGNELDFNLNEYITHQHDNYPDVSIDLPCGTIIEKRVIKEPW